MFHRGEWRTGSDVGADGLVLATSARVRALALELCGTCCASVWREHQARLVATECCVDGAH
jgi:hypothetical protein